LNTELIVAVKLYFVHLFMHLFLCLQLRARCRWQRQWQLSLILPHLGATVLAVVFQVWC